LERATWSK